MARILTIDHDPDMALVARLALERRGHEMSLSASTTGNQGRASDPSA